MKKYMKVVIFAGGKGSRLSEETDLKPKPMVEIGGHPILWHIMKMYSQHGINEFVICLGYKGGLIKEWFSHYFLYNSDVTFDLATNNMTIHHKRSENWKVTLVDTGLEANTATRLKRIKEYVGNDDFMLTYGDGVSDVDITKLLAFHNSHNKIATVTTVTPEGRFGTIKQGEKGEVTSFAEKIDNQDIWINGGFFVLRPEVFNFIPEDDVMWEREPLEKLTSEGELMAYKHDGFWKAMDMLRDKIQLEDMWKSGDAPWKTWQE